MNKVMEKYRAGVNLGGWISQYHAFDHEHFGSFITEKDIRQIASWGMDHIRLPVDYPVLEDDSRPKVYREDGFAYPDSCIEWCKKYGLNIVLDLHKAPGYSFGTLDTNSLFDDPAMADRFVSLWKAIASRYSSEGENVILELLNEVVEPTSDRWNKLAHETVAAIREIDKDRDIIIGGNHYNSIDMLKEIQLVKDDPHIVYTFHFYLPFLFTHQKASWTPVVRNYNQEVSYPGKCPGLKEFLDSHPEYKEGYEAFTGLQMDKELMIRDIKPAVDFIGSTHESVYCGEYGVIDHAPLASRINWHRDFADIMKQLEIGRACWSYKQMSFGLVDKNSNVINEELVKIVSEK